MKSGSLLNECFREQQSKNLMKLRNIGDHLVLPSPHALLNFSKGIIRDRDRDLSDLSEKEICDELKHQGVREVTRFVRKNASSLAKGSDSLTHLHPWRTVLRIQGFHAAPSAGK